jgi:molybdate transport system substrate-binding protein
MDRRARTGTATSVSGGATGTTCRRSSTARGGLFAFVRVLALACFAHVANAHAAELRVAAPNAVKESLTEIARRWEQASGHRIVFAWTGSEAITKRVTDGEVFDVVVNAAQNVDRLTGDGRLARGTRTDFARSGVGVAVRAGAPRPDVSSVESLKRALVAADTIAISSGTSGRYIESLFERMGIAEQVRPKIRQPPSGAQIGELIARGDAEIGFQQVTELLHASGVTFLGPLPAEIQNYTVWSAGQHAAAPQADAARDFLKALVAPESADAIGKTGMEPIRGR